MARIIKRVIEGNLNKLKQSDSGNQNKPKARHVLTIRGLDKMSREEKREIAYWLRDKAQLITSHENKFGSLFRARYF